MAHNELFHPLRSHPDDGITTGLDLGVRTGFGDERLSLGAMKVWIDGSGLGHTAATTTADGRPVGGVRQRPGPVAPGHHRRPPGRLAGGLPHHR